MNDDHVLEKVIPHRLGAIKILSAMCRFTQITAAGAEPSAVLFVDGHELMRGGAYAITNCLIESGLINFRALAGFLGIKLARNGSLTQARRESDDIMIETFVCNDQKALDKVSPDRLICWGTPHSPDDVGQAVRHTLTMANKAIAHMTRDYDLTSSDAELIPVACNCLVNAVLGELYAPLGRTTPHIRVREGGER